MLRISSFRGIGCTANIKSCMRCRLLRVLAWLSLAGLLACPAFGATTEKGAFEAAEQAFRDLSYNRAEKEFAAFIQNYTNSTRIPEALLMQAQARLFQSNYIGAVELLASGIPQSGKLADRYLFWLAQAHSLKGDYQPAADRFAELVRVYPDSPRRLEAAISETQARGKLGQWQQVVDLLQQPEGVFQTAARARATNEFVWRGHLLLGEAQFALGNYPAAQTAIEPLNQVPLAPRLAWQRQYLLCRIQFAQDKPADALLLVTNLLTLATNTAERPLMADSLRLHASLLEKLGLSEQAMDLYEKNLAEGFPLEHQRQALLKIAEISLARNRLSKAAQVLESFCTQHREPSTRQLALLTLGELRLREYISTPTNAAPAGVTNAAASTNALQQALAALETLVKEFPQGDHAGKAQLDLGWCYWVQAKLVEARAAFQVAVERLPASIDQATALIKLADVQLRLNDFGAAITNYTTLIDKYCKGAAVSNDLCEPALYQTVRAAIATNDLPTATSALGQLLTSYPKGYRTEHAVLFAGQAVTRRGQPAAARKIFLDFARVAPDSPLMSEVRLAIARTYEMEGLWTEVIEEYDRWLAQFTNSPARPRAEYLRAWANSQAGRETNAFQQFTNFLARFPQHECTPLAWWWVANYYYRTEQWNEAEMNFQLLNQSTNWPKTELSYQALMMAGRTAFRRLGWRDATNYFTRLTTDSKCPPEIVAQAMFAYGDVLMSRDSTNKFEDYALAASVFNNIAETFTTNAIAPLALGEKANCLLQWARSAPQIDAAAAEFQKVIAHPLANPTTRSVARVGLAVVKEKQAQQKTGPEQTALLKQALDLYQDVLYQKDLDEREQPDLFWINKSGQEAARLAEALQEWPQAVKIYERLCRTFPALRPGLEKKLSKAQENLVRTRS